MTLALLCSGQGRQHPAMFTLTGVVREADPLFAHAAALLGGRDPHDVIRGAAGMHGNRMGQVLCTLQALAGAALLGPALPDRLIIAGYSIGELAAWGVAGCFDQVKTLDLAACRAEAMDAVSSRGDGLTFVGGLSRQTVEDLCRRYGGGIAIINPGDAFLIGGSRVSRDAITADALRLGASRVVDLPVEAASHTSLLTHASGRFRDELKHTKASNPRTETRLLSSIDASPVVGLETGIDKLAAQISQTVRWSDCLQACLEAGATAFLELGPGRALADMIPAVQRDVPARSLEDFHTIEGAREWVRGAWA
jgi:[acyl-carrier-protein] S-malonyltransferase